MPRPFSTYIILFIYAFDLCGTSSGIFLVKFIVPAIIVMSQHKRVFFLHWCPGSYVPSSRDLELGLEHRLRTPWQVKETSNCQYELSLLHVRNVPWWKLFSLSNCLVNQLQLLSNDFIILSTGQNVYWKSRELRQKGVTKNNDRNDESGTDVIIVFGHQFFYG